MCVCGGGGGGGALRLLWMRSVLSGSQQIDKITFLPVHAKVEVAVVVFFVLTVPRCFNFKS